MIDINNQTLTSNTVMNKIYKLAGLPFQTGADRRKYHNTVVASSNPS